MAADGQLIVTKVLLFYYLKSQRREVVSVKLFTKGTLKIENNVIFVIWKSHTMQVSIDLLWESYNAGQYGSTPFQMCDFISL